MGRCALFALALLCTAAARAESMEELYAAARQEGALAFYAGGPTAPWEAFSKDFTARYPGIKVSITGGFSNVLDRQIDIGVIHHHDDVLAAHLQGTDRVAIGAGRGHQAARFR